MTTPITSKKDPQFGIFKAGEPHPFFVGNKEVVANCIEALRDSFFFVAGSAKPITDPFPFEVKPHITH